MILAERAARLQAEAVAASAKAEAADAKAAEALISYLKLEIENLRRQIYGSRSERKARPLRFRGGLLFSSCFQFRLRGTSPDQHA